MSEGRVLYNNASGIPITNANLRFDDPTVFRNSRLETNNIYVNNNIFVSGKIGIATANPKRELEVSGYAIINGNGSDSQENNEFGLNEPYDTLSIMSPSGIGTGGRTSIFFGLATVTNYPIARIVAGDVYGRTTLAFQTGIGDHLVERMRIDTNGYIGIGTPSPKYMLDVHGMAHITNNVFLNGQSILYRNYTIPSPTTGTLYLNFPNVGSTSTTIDIELSVCSTLGPNDSTMSKFTAFLTGYKGKGTGLYINNISVQTNDIAFFGPYNINTNTYDISGLSIQIDYVLAPTTAAVNYTAYGPGAYKITQIDISPTARVAGQPVPVVSDPPTNVQATGSPGQASVSWSAPSNNGGSDILGYIVSWDGGSKNAITTSTTITGLNNGTTYTFTVIALNTAGNSSGANSNSVSLASVPGTPYGINATAGYGSASLSWSAPGDGGLSITGYYITYNGGSVTVPGTSTVISGLTYGSSYNFTIYAQNSLGNSPGGVSNTVNPLQPTIPGIPTNMSADVNGLSVTLTWTPPFNGGSPITEYSIFISTTEYFTRDGILRNSDLINCYIKSGFSAIGASDITAPGNNTSCTINYPSSVAGYSFKADMYAVNSIGKSPFCDNIYTDKLSF